jgi:hypothetical protein
MTNPDVCDKCWNEYYNKKAVPESGRDRTCWDFKGWFCPETTDRKGADADKVTRT